MKPSDIEKAQAVTDEWCKAIGLTPSTLLRNSVAILVAVERAEALSSRLPPVYIKRVDMLKEFERKWEEQLGSQMLKDRNEGKEWKKTVAKFFWEEASKFEYEYLMASMQSAERASLPESVSEAPMHEVLAKCGAISKEISHEGTCRDQRIFMAAINWHREQVIENLRKWQRGEV